MRLYGKKTVGLAKCNDDVLVGCDYNVTCGLTAEKPELSVAAAMQ